MSKNNYKYTKIMTKAQELITTFQAFKTVHEQLRLDYKKICVQEFVKNNNEVTDRRLYAQEALKELQEIYNTAYGLFVFNDDKQLDEVYQKLLLCKIELGKI